jgi:septal ring factor EnvC (AmiA/AmiB activator)
MSIAWRLGLVLAVGPALLAPPATAQAPRREAAEIGDKQRDLQDAHKRLLEERQKAAAARKREAGVLSELEAIDQRLSDKRTQVAALDGRLRRAQADVGELQGEIGRLQSRRTGQEDVLGRRLRALYKLQAQGGVLPIVLSGADPVEQAVQLRHLATLASVDARLIREYRVTSEVLADRKSRVEARGREMAALRSEADHERAEFDQEAAKRRALLAKVQSERAYHDRMVGELSEATRRLEAFIRDLQEKQRRAMAKVPPPSRPARPTPGDNAGTGSGFAGLRGRLSWPADGRVVAEYGPQVNPRFGTKTFRNGIDIEASEGSNIAAVFPGHVVYTGWFRGYGNLIIVDHGGEYYTVYAHAADIRVTEGDEVKQGQIIGTVGDTGSLQGPRLYFEVRHEGKPQDPTQWLRPLAAR